MHKAIAFLICLLFSSGAWAACPGVSTDCGSIVAKDGSFGGKLTGKSITWLNAVDYGVKADGVTSDDVALKAAVDACAAKGATLILPPGQIMLSGATTINLQNCHLIGTGNLGPTLGVAGSFGTMFLITSTTVKPFNIGNSWAISGVNFFYPNQITGLTVYPPLLSPTTETTGTSGWYMDHVTLINPYDGIVAAGGAFEITDSYIYAMHHALRVANIGDSFRLNSIHFTPGPWFTMTNFTAPYTNVLSSNVMIFAQTGGNNAINFAAWNIGSFGFGNFLKMGPNVTVGISEFDVALDGIGTVIDASASNAIWAGFSSTPVRGVAGCSDTCFKLGNNSTLFIDGWTGGAAKSFIESTGSNIYLSNALITGVGSIADGGDYYVIHSTGNPGGEVISVQSSSMSGLPSSTKVHGIKTDVAASRLTVQNNGFIFFNDDMAFQTAGATNIITGNWSGGTQGAASFVLTGTNGIVYESNQWDKPPVPVVASGFGTSPTLAVGNDPKGFVINVGTGGTATSGTITMPFPAPHSYACTATQFTNSDLDVTVATPGSSTVISLLNYSRTTGVSKAWVANAGVSVNCIPY